ncbi:hypothetical protein U0X36_25800 [Bacillus thuringiensis]|uniref:hypothetical protein n=1 Tax=Bacillus thuringiensis TaxID=1428 RepID=UPI001EE98238|nr:hypothetical protein [Bacillus thuringiensis]MDZ3956228.1 hypothetical protein [Bacillus thuringiensis]
MSNLNFIVVKMWTTGSNEKEKLHSSLFLQWKKAIGFANKKINAFTKSSKNPIEEINIQEKVLDTKRVWILNDFYAKDGIYEERDMHIEVEQIKFQDQEEQNEFKDYIQGMIIELEDAISFMDIFKPYDLVDEEELDENGETDRVTRKEELLKRFRNFIESNMGMEI